VVAISSHSNTDARSEPMVKVDGLVKRFGRHTALDGISFTVEPGEIVGFLGPNGAGKTTTMRILTGYLPAGRGVVSVGGHPVVGGSLEVRRRIGYLPESCPLYPELRVNEYLKFRARIKGLHGRRRRARVREVKELCDLTEVGRRLIGHLSKGFRQRIGLADALLHEPDLLILDEPTIGLDPNQIRNIRKLIKDLGERHTVLLSTHILPEVEATCSRVLIIDKGRIVASDTPRNLKERRADKSRVEAEIAGSYQGVMDACRGLEGIREVEADVEGDWIYLHLEAEPGVDLRGDVFTLAARNGWKLRELRMASRSLEDVFEAVTIGEQRSDA
jgi:ABC-2 type transport system ATP-binding protein